MTSSNLRDRLIAGLEALGYVRPRTPRSQRFIMYERGDGRYWYIGSRGALRIGKNARDSMPAPKATQYYVLTAPQVRPVVFQLLSINPPTEGADLAAIANILTTYPALAGIPARTILNHIREWVRQSAPTA